MKRLLVTAGEPAGVGPELCVRALDQIGPDGLVVVGDPEDLKAQLASQESSLALKEVDVADAFTPGSDGELRVVPIRYPRRSVPGQPDPENARTQLSGLKLAALAALAGECDAIVTAPLQKSSIINAGIPFSGHTEYFAEICSTPLPVMLLTTGELRVALATTHISLSQVAPAITPERLRSVLLVLNSGLESRYGLAKPRIGVCGLNPHAGEGGHLGVEDGKIIEPVIRALCSEGLDLHGPLPADTAFAGDKVGAFDAILAMYHDQGLPVIKYAGFGNAVNVTLGLPIVRTSVDHGTALDLAGKGVANPGSLIAAIHEARRLCSNG